MSVKRFDQLEQNIKDALNNITPEPDNAVWEGIKSDLPKASAGSGFNWKIASAISGVMIIAAGAGIWYNSDSGEVTSQVKPNESVQELKLSDSKTELNSTETESKQKGESASGNNENNDKTELAVTSDQSVQQEEDVTENSNSTDETALAREQDVVNSTDLLVSENADKTVEEVSTSASVGESMVEVSLTDVCQGKAIECRTLNGESAVWDMGDGNRLEGYRIMYHYLRSGEFMVQAYQPNSAGELEAIDDQVEVTVYNKPDAGFEVIDANDFGRTETQFTAHEAIGEHLWKFGNGEFSNGNTVGHRYRNKGYYQVKHVVLSPDGCADSSTQNIRVSTAYNLMAKTVFNPNSESWLPEGLKEEGLKFELKIFDLSGNLAFSSNTTDNTWLGKTESGKDAREGDIFYWMALVTSPNGEVNEYGGNILKISR